MLDGTEIELKQLELDLLGLLIYAVDRPVQRSGEAVVEQVVATLRSRLGEAGAWIEDLRRRVTGW